MSKIKRISLTTLHVYLIVVPLSLLLESGPELRTFSTEGTDSGNIVSGELGYSRGLEIHIFGYKRPLVEGASRFVTTTTGRTVSSSRIMEGIVSGEIDLAKTQWQVNWGAIVSGFILIWIVVGFCYWVGFSWRAKPETQNNSGQAGDAKRD